MSLAVCKHSGQWEYFGKLFNIKGPTFVRLLTSFLNMLTDYAYDFYVDELQNNSRRQKLFVKRPLSKHTAWRVTPPS